jgi:putative inorganic carbon (hco3(-)) transporter
MLLNPFHRYFYVLAYLVMLYVRPHEFTEEGWPVPALTVLLVMAFVLWFFRQAHKDFEAPQFPLMVALLVVAVASVMATGWFGGAWKTFSDFAPVVMLYFVVATSVDSLERLYATLKVLAFCCAAIAAHGVVQWLEGQAWSPALPIQGRITYLGFLNDPNDLSMALLMVLPAIMLLAGRAGFLMAWVYRAIAAAIVFNVYLSNSRGAILALGVMLFIYSMRRFGLGKSLLMVPILLTPVILLAPSRMADLDASEDSAEGRIEAWYEGFQMVMQHPILGVGKGLFVDHHTLTAHNSYVLAVAEMGVLGYFVWFCILVTTWMMLRRIGAVPIDHSDTSAEAQRWIDVNVAARALWVGFIGGLVCAFFLSRTYVVVLYLHVALVVGLFQMGRKMRPNELQAVQMKPYLLRLLIGAIGSIIGLWIVTKVLLGFTG